MSDEAFDHVKEMVCLREVRKMGVASGMVTIQYHDRHDPLILR